MCDHHQDTDSVQCIDCGVVFVRERKRGTHPKRCPKCRECKPKDRNNGGDGVSCHRCGVRFCRVGKGRPSRYCSRSCANIDYKERAGFSKSPRDKQRTCKKCGQSFAPVCKPGSPPTLCANCKHEPVREGTRIETECEECGSGFCYLKKSKGKPMKYCSSACNYKAAARRKGVNVGVGIKRREPSTCKNCGVEFIPKAPDRRTYCSRDCSYSHKRKSKLGAYASSVVYSRTCRVCGSPFTTSAPNQKSCSTQCQEEHSRNKWAIRRASKLAAGYEYVPPREILDKNGWMCQICGRPTPKEKRGTHAKDAPEVDHIVPLARGGSHTRDNLQCACRECNQRKGDRLDSA